LSGSNSVDFTPSQLFNTISVADWRDFNKFTFIRGFNLDGQSSSQYSIFGQNSIPASFNSNMLNLRLIIKNLPAVMNSMVYFDIILFNQSALI